ncbi:MAG: acetoin utilization protein AcuC [Steroidobacteraceae bacterium]|nr:acetoin utilization protein AcuC [Steroidobacteraceae bacterium]
MRREWSGILPPHGVTLCYVRVGENHLSTKTSAQPPSSPDASRQVLVVAGERSARYGFPDGHPFGADRHAAFYAEFAARGLDKQVRLMETRAATRDELLSFHTPQYVELVEKRSATGEGYLDAGDTPAFRGVYEASADVVGGTLLAAEQIMTGKARRAFVPIAGLHHATRAGAAGFCVFNDCGVAVEMLRRNHGLKRIAYVDIDAHHGDGVFYGFVDDPDLIFADIHEDGRYLYPGTGREDETGLGAAKGSKLNIPVEPGADDAVFQAEWPRVLAHLEKFEPEFIILQAGADSIEGDPITHMRFSADSHRCAARDLSTLAEELGHGRVLGTGGGGYNRINLAQAWSGVVEGLLE